MCLEGTLRSQPLSVLLQCTMCCAKSCGDELEAAARAVNPRARVWRGSHEDRVEDQGITILGNPVGRPEFVERELAKILADHSALLTRIPEVQDLLCAWLLLLHMWSGESEFLHPHRSP